MAHEAHDSDIGQPRVSAFDHSGGGAATAGGSFPPETPGRSFGPLGGDGCRVGCDYGRTDDDRLPWDAGGRYGGWGGHEHFGTAPGASRPPVVFVHGNGRDACDWNPHAEYFLDNGYRGDELWAITFSEATTGHRAMVEQLQAFVSRVLAYTGRDEVALVAHSLGVTGARWWLRSYDGHERVETFVGLAGANHGLRLGTLCCRLGTTAGPLSVCRVLRDDYERHADHPLSALNADETPGDVAYYTIRGTDDDLFWGCRESPALAGARENLALRTDHEGVRASPEAIERVYDWVAPASTPGTPTPRCSADRVPDPTYRELYGLA
ncbi:esterase/lipase family protein [Halomarina pelagica]|uniref:esterase/lipase family protein n=1 Tax=Halomarina pelagica TaxID=2961599 RepID=UPI0020C527E4|nr:lipase family protein [Halomarina sp. BND7]